MDLTHTLTEALKAGLAVSSLMVGWLVVQAAWRRTFPEAVEPDGDALNSRGGCHGCEKEGSCSKSPTAHASHT